MTFEIKNKAKYIQNINAILRAKYYVCTLLLRLQNITSALYYCKTLISSAKNCVQIACAQLIQLIFPCNETWNLLLYPRTF